MSRVQVTLRPTDDISYYYHRYLHYYYYYYYYNNNLILISLSKLNLPLIGTCM